MTQKSTKAYNRALVYRREGSISTVFRGSLFVACIGVIDLVSSIGIPANGDVVTDWNTAALNAIRAGRTAPPIASRSLAILHISIYDAVNGIARTHEPYLVQSVAPSSASREAAASAAAHRVLGNLFPAAAFVDIFDTLHADSLEAIPDGPQKAAGIVWGEFVANQTLAARANDGSDAIVPPPGGAVRACGCRLLRPLLHICCRNGDSSRRLQ